ncbi:response regulator [Spirulina subsalsa]|nr:response regulator [Spirulina subsalsa]
MMPAKILVVDDEPDLEALLCQKFRRKIRRKELVLIFAQNGVEALARLEAESDVDMVLTDINMPQMDGLTLLTHINERYPLIKTVILSAYGDMESIRTAMNRGAFDFLTKPLNFEDLEITTNKTLQAVAQIKKAAEQERLAQQAQALQESERRLTQFLEAVPVGVFVVDARGQPYYANANALSLLGKDLPGVFGLRDSSDYEVYLAGGEQRYPKERQPMIRALGGESSTVDDMVLRIADRWIPLEVSATPIYDEQGDIIYAIAAFKDITQRKEAETERIRFTQELEAKNADLERLDRLKDEFLANTSHELRTPLNGMIGIAESMLAGAAGPLSEQQQVNLSMVVSSGQRLADLVTDVLDLSKLKNNDIELERKPIDFRQITEVVLTLCKPLVGDKAIELYNDIDPDLPLVDGDEKRLQQIMYNLIGNGIKFTEQGSVRVSASLQDDWLEIRVKDTGMGIPPAKLEVIFHYFEQADASISREFGGAGLGLSITKQLVELHGGKIEVRSQQTQGSEFIFTLPVSQQPWCDTPPIQPITIPRSQAPIPTQRLISPIIISENFKILVVDDDPINLQVIINHLSLESYQIIPVRSGPEALTLLTEGLKPDLMLLDVMMPKMSGYEVCRRIRETIPMNELPIVMLTANTQVSELVACLNVGANDYLTKPLSKNELLARLKTHLELAKINSAYSRFVPREFLRFLGKDSIVGVGLGESVQKELTILFSDIRSFTQLSEQMTPDDNFKFINAYLSRMEPAILENHGFIDKYIGDSIMALFGRSPDDAIRAAISMLEILNTYNLTRQRPGRPPLRIGVGINTGSAMLGTVGGINRMETTVISDAVNIAARLEYFTKICGTSVLISDQTFFGLESPENYHYRFLGKVQVKGKNQLISVFEIFDADEAGLREHKNRTKTDFEEAVMYYYGKNLKVAYKIFKQIQEDNYPDHVIDLYVQSCEHWLQNEGQLMPEVITPFLSSNWDMGKLQ